MGNSPTNRKRRINDGKEEQTGRKESDSGNTGQEAEQSGVGIIVYTDPWDVTGWNNEPDFRRLEETFGHNITVEYDFLPARTIEEWEGDTEMPTVDDPDLPESTKKSYQALKAAQEQGLARKYLRRLRIAALSEGRDIESVDVLFELADEIALNVDRLREDMTNVKIEGIESVEDTPKMKATIADIPHQWNGNIEFGRVRGRIVGEGVQPSSAERSISQFVADHELVTTIEVAEAFGLGRDEAIKQLQQHESIMSRDLGIGTYWFTN